MVPRAARRHAENHTVLPLNRMNSDAPFVWDGVQPLAVPLSRAPAVTGLSRSTIYREAARGNLKLIKAGKSTLLCMESARAFLAALPRAQVGGKRPADLPTAA